MLYKYEAATGLWSSANWFFLHFDDPSSLLWFSLAKMHAKSILVALAIPAFISGAAIPQEDFPENWEDNTSDIVGGVAAAQGDFPFLVSVQLSGSHFCGGTLLNANTVVSAAHCYYNRPGSWSIRAGSLVCASLFAKRLT